MNDHPRKRGWAIACVVLLLFIAWTAASAEARHWFLLRNTLLLAAGTCVLSLPLGTALAFLLSRTDLPGRKFLWVLFTSILFVPLYLQASAWDAGFGKLGWYSIIREMVDAPLLDGMAAAIWIHGLASIPWVMLVMTAGLQLLRPELEEEAILQGNVAQVFFRITLPRTMPAMIVAGVWVFLMTTGDMTVTDLYQVRTFAEELYTEFALGDSLTEILRTAVPGLMCSAVAAFLFAGVAAFQPPDDRVASQDQITFSLGKCRWLAFIMIGLLAFWMIGVPIANLLYKAGFTVEQIDGQRVRGWSLQQFCLVVFPAPVQFAKEIGWTLAIATPAAVLAVVVAAPTAWLARRGGWRSIPAWVGALGGLALPAPLIALVILWLMNRESPPGLIWLLDRTVTAPVLSAAIKTTPVAILIAWFGFRAISRDVLDSAATEGAGGIQRWHAITLPLCGPTIAAAWLASFAVAAGDLASTILVVPPNVTTVQIRVFGLVHAGVEYQVAALGLLGWLAYTTLALTALFLLRVSTRRQLR